MNADPVTFEILKNSLYAICDEMKSVIMRASFSPLLSLSADLSCVLVDTRGSVIAQGVDIPVHLGAATFTAKAVLERFPLSSWSDGDGVIVNDPYLGGTHLPDVSLLTPVYSASNLLIFVLSRMHWPDIGGIAAGSSSVTDEILKEGLRIPPVKIIEKGKLRRDLLDFILANVRVPRDREGDFYAALSGHKRATKRVSSLVERHGEKTFALVVKETLAHSARRASARLKLLPDSTVEHSETLDGDGIDESANPRICVKITKSSDEITFDFRGSSGAVKGPINAPLPVTSAAVFYIVLCLVGGDISPNSGVYSKVSILTEKGSIVDAQFPSPVVAANTETANRIVDILWAALSKAYPDLSPAGSYGSACVYTLSALAKGPSEPFVHYETIGGGLGGSSDGPGLSGFRVHMGNTMNLPIESLEASMPLRFHSYEIVPETAGQGRNPGGGGVRKIVEALIDGVEASVLGERTQSAAHGVSGGSPGGLAQFQLIRNGVTFELGSKSGPHLLNKGDRLVMLTAGGGGWGASKI